MRRAALLAAGRARCGRILPQERRVGAGLRFLRRCLPALGRILPQERVGGRVGVTERCAASQGRTTATKRSGCSRWAAWPAPSTRARVADGPMASAIRAPRAANFSSRAPATTSTGIVSSARRSQDGRLRAGAGQPQARGQPGHGVLGPLGAERPGRRDAAEHRLVEPLVEERHEADLLQSLRRAVVLLGASGALGRVLDPGGAPDEHQAADEARLARGPGSGRGGRPSSSRGRSPGRRLRPTAARPRRGRRAPHSTRRDLERRRAPPRDRPPARRPRDPSSDGPG